MVVLRSLIPLVGIGLSSITGVLAAATDNDTSTQEQNIIVPGAFIVEFEDSGASAENSGDFFTTLQSDNINAKPRLSLSSSIFKGASFELDDEDPESTAKKIAENPNVKRLWPVRVVNLPKNEFVAAGSEMSRELIAHTHNSLFRRDVGGGGGADAYEPHVMTQVDKLHAAGFTGSGIRIGVVDSGVDYTHPAMGGCFGEGCLNTHGYDFVGDNFTGLNKPVPDDDPMDSCYGHGTHVSGIIAARENPLGFTGAAPNVTLGQYRVFSCNGASSTDILVAAFIKAYEDGNDIISCSAGFASGWSEDVWAVTAERIVNAGVPVIVAAGNDGESGLLKASTPANGKGVVSVASTNTYTYPQFLNSGIFSVDNGTSANFGWKAGVQPLGNLTLPLYATSNDSTTKTDACNPLPDDTPDLSKYLVLVRESPCRDFTQLANIQAKGGKNILWYSMTNMTVSFYTDKSVQSGTVPAAYGTKWVDALNAGKEVVVTVTEPRYSAPVNFPVPADDAAGFTSFFTSFGPDWDLDLNPEVAAPGSKILSTYPLAMGGYAILQGTSMACHLAASVFALVAEARGTLDAKTLKNAISSTAKPNLWNDRVNTFDILAPVAQQGAGVVQAYDAAMQKTIVSTNSILFNDTANFKGEHEFEVHNTDSKDVTYKVSHVKAATMDFLVENGTGAGRFPNPVREAWATIDFSEDSITVPAGGKAKISLKAQPPKGLDEINVPVYSGYVVLNGTNGENLSIPYLGAAGSMKKINLIDTRFLKTVLTNSTDRWGMSVPDDTLYILPKPTNATNPQKPDPTITWPQCKLSLIAGTRSLRTDVVAVGETSLPTEKFLGYDSVGQLWNYPLEYATRAWDAISFVGILADGTVVPEGTYRVVVSALRIFGDPEKKEDWHAVETARFRLKYE